MTKAEREAFLAGVHIGVLAVNDDAAPVLTPIWYSYEPGGDVMMETQAGSPKAKALRASGRASLCAQTETAPYQYVVVEGPVTIVDGVDPAKRRALAHRYLGAELGDMYYDATVDSEDGAVTVHLPRTVEDDRLLQAVRLTIRSCAVQAPIRCSISARTRTRA
jgi:PPOX class probable F420-dependent enzyme